MNDSFDLNLDLLLDGELTEEQRTEFLMQLEQSEGGWKNCALRFLEAQSWQSALEKNSTPTEKRRSIWPLPLTAAASVALGFFLAPQNPPEPVVDNTPPKIMEEIVQTPSFADLHLIPSRDESGSIFYICRDRLPVDILQAFQLAGHRVQEVEKMIPLSNSSTSLASLPLRETHIHINPNL